MRNQLKTMVTSVILVGMMSLSAIAQNKDQIPGTYIVDAAGMEQAAIATIRQEIEKKEAPQETKNQELSQLEAMVPQIRLMIDQMKIELVLVADGTFKASGAVGEETMVSSGTWRLGDKKITFVTTSENGKDLEKPSEVIADYDNGVLRLKPHERSPLVFVMVKKT